MKATDISNEPAFLLSCDLGLSGRIKRVGDRVFFIEEEVKKHEYL